VTRLAQSGDTLARPGRYHGGAAKVFKDNVRDVVVVAPNRVRFVFREPWPDFMTFYGTLAATPGWIVPKKYVERG
jgi:peptide/nickel transport system substrate-binding protein